MAVKNYVVKFGKRLDGAKVFKDMLDSGYMQRQGYDVMYSRNYKDDKGNIELFGLCYVKEGTKSIYIHVRVKSGLISTFSYFIGMGDIAKINSDMLALAKKIK